MKKFVSIFVTLCSVFALCVVATPAYVSTKELVTTSDLHMRSKPGKHGKSITILKKGSKVKSQRVSNGWHRIAFKGKTGWASGKYLKPVKKSKSSVKRASAPKGKHAVLRSIANKHGCSSSKIVYNNQRILHGHAATADWFNNTIHINSSKSLGFLKYAVAHECAHMKQYVKYGGNIDRLKRDMNRVYGGSGFTGLERNADCVAQHWGYRTHVYTSNCGGNRGKVARDIARVKVRY